MEQPKATVKPNIWQRQLKTTEAEAEVNLRCEELFIQR